MDDDLLDFTRTVIAFRREHPVFHQRRWFEGREVRGGRELDIAWFTPEGEEMRPEYWEAGFAKSLLVWLNGKAITALDRWGERVVDDSFCVLFNAHHEALSFTLPGPEWGSRWEVAVDTRWTTFAERPRYYLLPANEVVVSGRGIVVLRCRERDRE